MVTQLFYYSRKCAECLFACNIKAFGELVSCDDLVQKWQVEFEKYHFAECNDIEDIVFVCFEANLV